MGQENQYSGQNTAALISSAGTIASNAINAIAQSSINKRTKDYNIQMYAQQRKDATADWNKQNEYNSPAAQMARFKAAGLNPNLIYGRGDSGNAAPVRSSSPQAWNPKAPDYSGIGQSIGQYYNTKMQQAQLDNLLQQNQVLQAQTKQITAQTEKTNTEIPNIGAETDLRRWQLSFNKATEEVNKDIKAGELGKIKADTEYTLDKNTREALSNIVSVKEGLTRILKMQQETTNLQTTKLEIEKKIQLLDQDSQLKDLDLQLIRASGNTLRPGDNVLFRAISKILEEWDKSKKDPKSFGSFDFDSNLIKQGFKVNPDGTLYQP